MPNRIRLNIHTLNLPPLNHDRISLAPIITQEARRWELHIESAGEVSGLVAEEADSRAGIFVEGFSPCVHAREEVSCVIAIA